ncbi:MAG: hypothetical protein QOI21_4679 [Actinomycetota bacterium]|nr:hypothetical protein [Actinomycetota bacterium]
MANKAASQAQHNKVTQTLGRAGMACYGLVHLVVAYLAVQVAFGGSSSNQSADQRGALSEIGSTPFGKVLLWVLAVGLIAFGLWQFLMAAKGYSWIAEKRKRVTKRIGSGARGVVGVALGILAIRLATGSASGGSGNQQQQEFTAKLLSLPAGRVLVAIAAAAVLGVAIASAIKGFKRSFLDDLDTGELPPGTRKWVERLGMSGYLAKAVVFGIVAVLIGFAALSSDAGKAGGLDAALRTLAAQPFGPFLLAVVALGLAAFGVYCFAAAKSHKS